MAAGVLCALLVSILLVAAEGGTVGAPQLHLTPATTGPSASVPTSVVVGAVSAATAVPSETLGVNLAADNHWNATVASLINGTTARYLRYPSGVCGEGLNWTSGVSYGDLCYNNQIHITVAAFVADCEMVRCQAIMQLPTEIDSPSTAAYYVQYLEQTLGFTPAYYELGNEPTQWTHFGCAWSTWTTTCATGTNATPQTYPAVVGAYVQAIRQEGSTVPILALGGTGQSSTSYGEHENAYAWAYAIFRAVGNEVQGISVHDYPGRLTTPTSNASFYANLVSGDPVPTNVGQTVDGIRAACANCTDAKIFVTEGNMYTCGSCNQLYQNSFGEALAMAAYYVQAIDSGASSVELEALYNGAHSGNWFGPATPEPIYYLYSDIFTQMPLADGTAAWLPVDQLSGPGMLWFGATYEATGRWTLLALNLNVSTSASLALSGFPTTGAFQTLRWNGSTVQPVVSAVTSTLPSLQLGPQSMLLVVSNGTVNATAPPAPSALRGTASSSSAIDWSWTQSPGMLNDTFELYAGATCAASPSVADLGSAVTSYVSTGLPSAATFSARVVAWGATGPSLPSACANATTDTAGTTASSPTAPSSLAATLTTNSSITWSWSQGSEVTNDTVVLYRDGTCAGTADRTASTSGAAETYTFTGLTSLTNYSAEVEAWNGSAASPFSSCASATTTAMANGSGVPSAPTGLRATSVASSRITWSWSQGVGILNDTLYLYRDASCTGSADRVTSTSGPSTSYTSDRLSSSTAYSAYVVAWNASGPSAPSTCAAAMTSASGHHSRGGWSSLGITQSGVASALTLIGPASPNAAVRGAWVGIAVVAAGLALYVALYRRSAGR